MEIFQPNYSTVQLFNYSNPAYRGVWEIDEQLNSSLLTADTRF